jgi:DNA-3-methyladenine glycosylase I
MKSTVQGPDGALRCNWCSAAELFEYHDHEWGYPVDNDIRLFEKLCLESFQSGLSWRIILAKRANFRAAFSNFDFHIVAKYNDSDIKRLLQNEGIVRHRGKIEAVINNAKKARELAEQEGSLAAYFWQFEPDEKSLPEPQTASISEESIALSKALKKQGWKFVGPTTVYAFMQAMGLINDHSEGCVFREKVEQTRNNFRRPGRV